MKQPAQNIVRPHPYRRSRAWTIFSAIFFGLVSINAWAGEKEAPLVQIFCDAVIARAQVGAAKPDGTPEADLSEGRELSESEAWDRLVQRLESREPIPEARVLDPVAYERCLQENRQEFQDAEFILDGKKLLEETVKSPKKPEPSLPREAAQINLGGLGSFSLDFSAQSNARRTVSIDDERQREGRYQDLWRSFLSRLRGNFAPHRAALEVTDSRD
jgi:hypothetical protein